MPEGTWVSAHCTKMSPAHGSTIQLPQSLQLVYYARTPEENQIIRMAANAADLRGSPAECVVRLVDLLFYASTGSNNAPAAIAIVPMEGKAVKSQASKASSSSASTDPLSQMFDSFIGGMMSSSSSTSSSKTVGGTPLSARRACGVFPYSKEHAGHPEYKDKTPSRIPNPMYLVWQPGRERWIIGPIKEPPYGEPYTKPGLDWRLTAYNNHAIHTVEHIRGIWHVQERNCYHPVPLAMSARFNINVEFAQCLRAIALLCRDEAAAEALVQHGALRGFADRLNWQQSATSRFLAPDIVNTINELMRNGFVPSNKLITDGLDRGWRGEGTFFKRSVR